MADLQLTVRYLRHGTDVGTPCRERELVLAEGQWKIPTEQSALVLVDCWAEHFIETHAENCGRIMAEVLAPVVEAARKAGVTIIHAPSPTYVEHYPQWTAYADDRDLGPPPPPDDWPPQAFRAKEGDYAQYARHPEPKIQAWTKDASHYRIADVLEPQPGDFVVKNGDQLHRLLKHRKLLHLFYAGFATNICVLFRDYGTRAMSQRGYNVLLLRDCTTGIESRDTVADGAMTRWAIQTIELVAGHSLTSCEFLRACAALGQPRL